MSSKINSLIGSNLFNNFIMLVIIVNSILIGVETFYTSTIITVIQNIILVIYIAEIILRWIGKESMKLGYNGGAGE